jgi:hypothetical protein
MGILGWFQKKPQGQQRPSFRVQGGIWIREVEHLVLRLVSLGFSLASAHAIRWFFSPLDGADVLQPFVTWIIAGGFGVLGYFLSRGLAHRLMNGESFWAYLPICVVVEFVEIFCNFALAASVISHATWLDVVSEGQRTALIFMTYVALSIIPLVTVLLAVVDMDLERRNQTGSYAQPKLAVSASSWGQPLQFGQGGSGGNGVPSRGNPGRVAFNGGRAGRAPGNGPLVGDKTEELVIP